MIFKETPLSGNYLIDLDFQVDNRGFFARYFCEKEFSEMGLNTHWVQINNSMSVEVGTLRGLHFQKSPNAEVKLVRCLKGSIWDVVVDIRQNSDTFGMWFGSTLSDKNRTMMYVPKGFAHGFISLEPNSEILYLVSDLYVPESENTLIWNDPSIGIQWPVKPQIFSSKDLVGKLLTDIVPVSID